MKKLFTWMGFMYYAHESKTLIVLFTPATMTLVWLVWSASIRKESTTLFIAFAILTAMAIILTSICARWKNPMRNEWIAREKAYALSKTYPFVKNETDPKKLGRIIILLEETERLLGRADSLAEDEKQLRGMTEELTERAYKLVETAPINHEDLS